MSEITEIWEEVQEVSEETSEEAIVREEEISEMAVQTGINHILEKWKTFFKRNVPEYEVRCLWRQQFYEEHR